MRVIWLAGLLALGACDKERQLRDYRDKAKLTEAHVQLGALARKAKAYVMEHATFPGGDAGPTPATPCCAQPNHRCKSVEADWSAPPWTLLDFRIDEDLRFQYSYHGVDNGFTATAVGDPDCDGHPITITAHGTLTSGNASVTIDEGPPP